MSSEQDWRQWLLGYARRWCRCYDDAHDMVQEALIAFFVKHRGRMPWEWSNPVEAQRHALRLLRDKHAESCRRLHAACSYEQLSVDLPDARETEQELYERLDFTLLLARLATRLSPRQQAVLNFLAEGYELREIASQLGISVGAVKRYVHLIRQKAHDLCDHDATFCPTSVGSDSGAQQTGGMRDGTIGDGLESFEHAEGGVEPCFYALGSSWDQWTSRGLNQLACQEGCW